MDWALGEEYLKLENDQSVESLAADDEVTEKLRRKANISKHLTTVRDAADKADE